MAAAPPTNASNAELVRWAFEQTNSHDTSALRQFWTQDTFERFPDRECRGPDEIAAYFEGVFAAVPDYHMDVRSIVEQGDDVYVHWHMTGTHTGESFQGIDATGKRLAIDGMDHFVMRDGKMVSNFVVFDQMQFARQIGLLPEEGSAADKAVKLAFNAKTKIAAALAEQRETRRTRRDEAGSSAA